MIKVLHIIEDKKFVKMCQDTFNMEGVKNSYLSEDDDWNVPCKLQPYDVLIIHYLSFQKAKKLLEYKLDIPIVWFVWGADVYQLGEFRNKILLPKTARKMLVLEFNKSIKHGGSIFAKKVFPKIFDTYSKIKVFTKALHKIDGVVCIMPQEIELIKDLKYFNNPKFYHINYLNTLIERVKEPEKQKGDAILLGNSASYTNNHIELIDLLSKQTLTQQVIFPLNYGEAHYRKWIIQYAKKKLKGVDMYFLTEFLPFDSYQKLMDNCGIMVMNHIRQQALGNIIQALLSGIHVYLNFLSPIYDFLQKNGIHVSSSTDLTGLRLLSDAEQIKNYTIAKEIFGKKLQQQRIAKMLDSVLEKK